MSCKNQLGYAYFLALAMLCNFLITHITFSNFSCNLGRHACERASFCFLFNFWSRTSHIVINRYQVYLSSNNAKYSKLHFFVHGMPTKQVLCINVFSFVGDVCFLMNALSMSIYKSSFLPDFRKFSLFHVCNECTAKLEAGHKVIKIGELILLN